LRLVKTKPPGNSFYPAARMQRTRVSA